MSVVHSLILNLNFKHTPRILYDRVLWSFMQENIIWVFRSLAILEAF